MTAEVALDIGLIKESLRNLSDQMIPLRDRFAMAALTGLIPIHLSDIGASEVRGQIALLSAESYQIADAMLAAREQERAS